MKRFADPRIPEIQRQSLRPVMPCGIEIGPYSLFRERRLNLAEARVNRLLIIHMYEAIELL